MMALNEPGPMPFHLALNLQGGSDAARLTRQEDLLWNPLHQINRQANQHNDQQQGGYVMPRPVDFALCDDLVTIIAQGRSDQREKPQGASQE